MTTSLDPVVAERLAESRAVFTCDLGATDLALLGHVRMRPIAVVTGVSVYRLGWAPDLGTVPGEQRELSRAGYEARMNALERLVQEAVSLGADGVLGVHLAARPHGVDPDHWEFVASGTAVGATDEPGWARRPDGSPFTSHLGVRDLYQLVLSGWVPVAYTIGTCVDHVAPPGSSPTREAVEGVAAGMPVANVEMTSWTRGRHAARELAMTGMTYEAERVGGTGVLGVSVEVSGWGLGPATVEFCAAGTTVRAQSRASGFDPGVVVAL